MNYNFLNTNLLTNMCNYNTTGASLTPYLFSGVDGLSIFTNYNNGYGSYGNYGYGSCSNTSSGVWGAIGLALGSVAASIGIGIAGKSINNHIAKNNAKEAQNKKDVEAFNKAIAELGLSEKSPLEITEATLDSAVKEDNLKDKAKLDEAINKAKGEKEQADQNLNEAKSEVNAKLTGAESDYNSKKSTYEDLLQKQANGQATADQVSAAKILMDSAKAELERLQELKKSTEPGGELYKAHEQAKKDLEKAEQAQKDALDKLQEQADIAKQYLAKAQEAAKAELNDGIDDADGNWFTRMGKRNFEVGEDGTITGDANDITDRDIRKLGYRFRTGTNEERAKIKAYIEKNEDKLRGKVKSGSDEETILNSILNS